jgi:stage V sporulation protein G
MVRAVSRRTGGFVKFLVGIRPVVHVACMGAVAVDITEVRIKLMEESEDRLRAFCSITFDGCFVVRDLKIIEGSQGPFVAMPSRKLTNRCARCGNKNAMRSNYCNNCGVRLRESRDARDEDAPNKLYADVAHPINQACRDLIQQHVVAEYELELERAKLPGYISRYDDAYDAGEAGNDYLEPRPRRTESTGVTNSFVVQPPHFKPGGETGRPSADATEKADAQADDEK